MREIHVLTDGLGDSGVRVTEAVMKQFPTETYRIRVHRFVRSEESVDRAVREMPEDAIVFMTLIGKRIREYALKAAAPRKVLDVTGYVTEGIEDAIKVAPIDCHDPFFRRRDENYFRRIEAIEFAVRYDDGKDPRGIPKADVVLVGVSRTSKTPTAMFLANYSLKVANLPLVPEIPLPKEIFEKDKEKIFGLIINPKNLNDIRMERLREMGLTTENSSYADLDRIREELEYARGVMDKLGAYVIDVSDKNIEETAVMIMNRLEA